MVAIPLAAVAIAAVWTACNRLEAADGPDLLAGFRPRVSVEDYRRAVRLAAEEPSALGPQLESLLDSAYTSRSYRSIWTSRRGLNRRGRDLLAALEDAPTDGLDPERYGLDLIRGDLTALEEGVGGRSARASRLADLELRLSAAYLRHVQDLLEGALHPEEAGLEWEMEPEGVVGNPLLDAAGKRRVDDYPEDLRPELPYYERMRTALAALRAIGRDGGWPQVRVSGTPTPGSAASVTTVRARLLLSVDPEERRLAAAGLATPAAYDSALGDAVRSFQRRHGLSADAELGRVTVAEMNVPVEDRILSVGMNMDRLRWIPRSPGERVIFVNVAGFELELLERNQPRLSMNVVVGKPSWATRLFTARMDHLVFNPYWNVPASILADEILPALERDPGYLEANGFEVVGADQTVVEGARLDELDPELRVRQRPGPANALGRVKFMFPNEHSIYLHDSPARELYERSYRAFSHGCIRLEKPIELARYLVEHYTDAPATLVDEALAEEGERTVMLDLPLDVYLVYLTAWVDEGGALYFYRDIYDHDRRLGPQAAERLADEAVEEPRAP